MEVVAAFKKKDGTITPEMTAEEINQGKYKEYGVTDQEVKDMFLKYQKTLIEGTYPDVKIEPKTEKEQSRSA